jgi:hypothetical protein
LGDYFLDALFADIDSLLIYGGVHQFFIANLYGMPAKRFPFAIYYKKQDNLVQVYAVLDTRRKPAWINETLDNI